MQDVRPGVPAGVRDQMMSPQPKPTMTPEEIEVWERNLPLERWADPPHGTRARYMSATAGCRCPDCRFANAAYGAARKARKIAQA